MHALYLIKVSKLFFFAILLKSLCRLVRRLKLLPASWTFVSLLWWCWFPDSEKMANFYFRKKFQIVKTPAAIITKLESSSWPRILLKDTNWSSGLLLMPWTTRPLASLGHNDQYKQCPKGVRRSAACCILCSWQLFFTRGRFWPSGIVVACVCVSVCPCVYQSPACSHDNSGPVQARITKFGPIVLGGNRPWPSRSNLT